MEATAPSAWFVVLPIVGAMQGFFLAAILASWHRNAIANKYLALAMLTFSIDLSAAAYQTLGLHRTLPHFIGVDFPLAFLYGPLFYLYARTVISPTKRFARRTLLHFVPFALVVMILVPFYASSGMAKLAVLEGNGTLLTDSTVVVINNVKLMHASVYIVFIFVLLRRHRTRLKDSHSNIERINLLWLRNLLIGIVVLTVNALLLYLLGSSENAPRMGLNPDNVYDDLTLIGVTVFVYVIGYLGLRQPEIFSPASEGHSRSTDDATSVRWPAATSDSERNHAPPYAKSNLDPDEAKQYIQAIKNLMADEKPYRHGSLKLQELADAVSLPPHTVTQVINTQLNQNFYDFVNGYRVEEAKKQLLDPSNAHLTILAIGLEAGFNSKSSFNAVFKKHTGLTPSHFRRDAR